MNIKYITCSGTNETTNIERLCKIMASYPYAEIGVQVSEKKCFFNSPRMVWIRTLANYLSLRGQAIDAALHINPSWVEDVGQGILAPELQHLLSMRNIYGDPFFRRIQLNFKIGRDRTPDEYRLLNLMQMYQSRHFIFSYNEKNAEFIHEMYKLCNEVGIEFDILYDDSHGEGIAPRSRKAPVFPDVCQGYAGGISPENVAEVLEQISLAQKPKYSHTGITIDAEGKLKDADGHLDLNLCQAYLHAAHNWIKKNLY